VDANLPAQRKMIAAAAAAEKFGYFAWRASEAAFETQYVYGRAGRLLDVEFSLSRGDLWEPVRVGNHVGADCRGVGSSEVDSRVFDESKLVP